MKSVLFFMLFNWSFSPKQISTDSPEAVWYPGLKSNTNDTLVCATYQFPKETFIEITNLKNNKSVIVRVTDRGPHGPNGKPHKKRLFDLSKEAFNHIADIKQGVIKISYKKID
jgi:rare lipoprotein A